MIFFLKNKSLFLYFAFSILLLIFVLKIFGSYLLDIPLHFDEAQYWEWSQNLEWGYFSKPPLLATLIKLSTLLCGDTEFCIRLSSPILYLLSSILIFFSVKLLTKSNYLSGFSAFVFYLMPGITFSSFVISTDVPLIFFSSAFAYLFLLIYKKKNCSISYFFLLGIVSSLGFLSKYAMAYHLTTLIILFIFYKNVRTKFLSYKFIFFIIPTIILLLPHLYWNYINSFVTFNHTADNANFQKIVINIKELVLFLMSQFIVFGIYPFYCITKKIYFLKHFEEEMEILYIFFLLPIIIIAFVALLSRANANWAVVGYPFGCILLAKILERKDYMHKRMYSLISQIVLGISIVIIISIGKYTSAVDPFAKQKYARDLAKEIKKELASIENVAFMADDREDYALMLFYLKGFNGKRAKWNGDIKINDHYELTTNVNNLKGHNILFLTRTTPTEKMLDRSNSSKFLKSLSFKERNKTKVFNLYLLKDWR